LSFLKRYKGKIIAIVSSNCPACRTLKMRVEKDQIMKDKFVFLNVENNEVAQLLAEAFGITEVPSYISVDVKRGKITVCKWDSDMKNIEGCLEVEEEKKRKRRRKKAT